jgi:membrane-associated phospholipid phosphatase
VKPSLFAVQIWLVSFVICAAGIALSFLHADVPIALYCSKYLNYLGALESDLGSAVLLLVEAVTAITLVFVRLMRGKLAPVAEAVGVACLTSICVYGINNSVLKLFFGVPNPSDVLHGVKHAFNFWGGSPDSSFPSGHMVLAAAFAGVFMRLYRGSIWLFSALLLVGAALLVAGIWHFLSDVIAGAFVGLSAGLLAGELWEAHSH